jgi:salicylate hydroxylase
MRVVVAGPLSAYHRDRTVLVGDAAHAVGAGQGASMALEDAVVLAQHVHRAPMPDMLADYAEARWPRAAKLAKLATANRDAKTAGPVASRLRNLIMPVVFPRMYPRATDWLHSYDPGAVPRVKTRAA